MPVTVDIIEFADLRMGKNAVRKWTIEVEVPNGVTVSGSGHSVTHIPPSGAATTPSISSSANNVTVTFGPVTVTGLHYLECLIAFSNSEIKHVRLSVDVPAWPT